MRRQIARTCLDHLLTAASEPIGSKEPAEELHRDRQHGRQSGDKTVSLENWELVGFLVAVKAQEHRISWIFRVYSEIRQMKISHCLILLAEVVCRANAQSLFVKGEISQ